MSADVPGDDPSSPIDPWKPIDAPPIDEPDGPLYFPLNAPQGADGRPVAAEPGVVGAPPAPAPVPDEDLQGRPWSWWVGPLAVLTALIGVTIVSVLFVFIAIGLSSGHPTAEQISDRYEHWFGLGQDGLWILIAITTPYVFTFYLRPGQLGMRKPPRVGRAIGVFLLSFFVFYALAYLYSTIFDLNDQSNSLLDTDSGFGDTVVRDVAYALLYTVAAPVAEELLFRGLLFRTIRDGFAKRTGRAAPWLAALISGVIFGGIHYSPAAANQNNYLPVLMALGVLLALAYNFSGTIYVNILLHSINNAIATGSNTTPTHHWVYILIGVGPLIAMALVFVLSRAVRAVFPSQPRNSAHPPSAEPAIV